jgi:hypothetical protein
LIESDIIAALSECTDLTALSAIGVALAARIAALASSSNGKSDDRAVSVREAAELTGLSESALYHGNFPFEIKGKAQGRKRTFSYNGIQRYIARNTGKP